MNKTIRKNQTSLNWQADIKRTITFISIVFLALFNFQSDVKAQNAFGNFEFNQSTLDGWTLSGPFDLNNSGPFQSNFSQLIWTDSVNGSNSNIFDSPNNGQGAISFFTNGELSIQGINGNTWVMSLLSPDLSSSPQWFTAQGFDISIAQTIATNTDIFVDLSMEVLDKNTNQIVKITKTGRHTIVSDVWNKIRFIDWNNLEGFPQNYSLQRFQINIMGSIDAVNNGSFYVDDLILIPGRNFKIEYPLQIENETYEMLSFPFHTFGEFEDIFADDYGAQSPDNWRIFRWNEATNKYFEHPQTFIDVNPGVGFWFIKRGGSGFDIDFTQPVSTNKPFTIRIEPGWNQVGNPFPFPIAIDSIIATSPIGINSVNKWNSSTEEYEPGQTVIEPFVGYFIDNQSADQISLTIPPIENSIGTKPLFTVTDKSKGEFVLQLKMENSRTYKVDTQNFIGMLSQTENELNKFNFRDAPSVVDKTNLTIVKNEKRYSGNFTSVNNDGAFWDLEISNIKNDESGNFTIENLNDLPSNFGVWLLDLTNNKSIRINESSAIINNSSYSLYRLIVGTNTYAESNNNEINLEPMDYSLLQNYPNPFNATTTIKYSIADDSNVTLKIFDVIGREIKTLTNNEFQKAGYKTTYWNGKNNSGNVVSSGLYFYRISTEKFTQTNKMLLLK